MKKQLILLLSLFLLQIQSKSQTEFAPIGATWYYEMGWYFQFGPYRSFYKAESVRDTILSGHLSKVIEFTYYDKYGDTVDWGQEFFYGDEEEVYHYDKENDEFYLLFNFNVNNGDTLKIREGPFDGYLWNANDPWDYDFFWVKVIDIDTVDISGINLKTVYTSIIATGVPESTKWGDYFYYTQRIGCISSFFGISPYEPAEKPGPIRCYEDNEIFYNHAEVRCDTLEGIEDIISIFAINIDIFPNPFYDKISINFKDIISNNIVLKVYNIYGETICSKGIYRKEESMNFENLKPGIYFLKIINEQNQVTIIKKIIKL